MRVAHEAGDTGGVTHDGPAVFVEVHAHQHVAGDAHAGDHLALAVLDLDDVFHRNLDLVDVIFHGHRLLAVLDVLLHAAFEAGVGVDDEPLAGQEAQFLAELLVRVFVGLGLGVDLFFVFDGFDGGLGLVGGVDVERVVDDGVGLGVGGLGEGVERGVEVVFDVGVLVIDVQRRPARRPRQTSSSAARVLPSCASSSSADCSAAVAQSTSS